MVQIPSPGKWMSMLGDKVGKRERKRTRVQGRIRPSVREQNYMENLKVSELGGMHGEKISSSLLFWARQQPPFFFFSIPRWKNLHFQRVFLNFSKCAYRVFLHPFPLGSPISSSGKHKKGFFSSPNFRTIKVGARIFCCFIIRNDKKVENAR